MWPHKPAMSRPLPLKEDIIIFEAAKEVAAQASVDIKSAEKERSKRRAEQAKSKRLEAKTQRLEAKAKWLAQKPKKTA